MGVKTLVLGSALLCLVVGLGQAAELPVTRVVLFSSGVGYFEREGAVQGDASVELSFRVDQIPDILKSLILQDLGGGNIAPVTYSPRDPLERTLSSFSVNISDNPSLEDLCNRLRGTRVEVGAEKPITGVVLGTEKQQKVEKEQLITFAVLNVLTDAGIVAIPLPQIAHLKLLDPKLDAELQGALQAIDKARDHDKRPLTLRFKGEGERKVRVGYLLETPVWKTSYRLVSDSDGLFLQGWAIVENTMDEDWQNVTMCLVSGRPVSFIQDLYEPLYVRRPQVPVSVAAAAAPRVYAGAMETPAAHAAVPPPAPGGAPVTLLRAAPGGGGSGYGGMAGGGMGGGGYATGMAGPRGDAGPAGPAGADAAVSLGRLAAGGVMAAGGKVGTLFQYAINQPVTVPRQRSSMIPIIGEKVEGAKVSVYNQQADPKHPMNGIKLKNTSKLHLMGGAVTVFDGGVYGGDALIEDMAPGEERLLTYAMDLEVEVDPKVKPQPEEILSGKIVRGVMVVQHKSRLETTYAARNRAGEPRTLLIEHPVRADWTLVEPKAPDETTRSVYRFKMPLDPGKTGELKVTQEWVRSEYMRLTDQAPDQVKMLVITPHLSDGMRAALQKIVEMQAHIADLQHQLADKEARIKEIEQEQDRIRKNMEQLDHQSQLYRQYVEKFANQETEFEGLRTDSKKLREELAARQSELQAYIAALTVD